MAFSLVDSTTHIISSYNVAMKTASGIKQIVAAAEDGQSFFKYGRDVERVKKKVDLSGGVHYSVNANQSGFIEFNVLHTSPICKILSESSVLADMVGETIVSSDVAFIIQTNELLPFLWANKCRLEKQPDGERGAEIGVLTYRFLVGQLIVAEIGLQHDSFF